MADTKASSKRPISIPAAWNGEVYPQVSTAEKQRVISPLDRLD